MNQIQLTTVATMTSREMAEVTEKRHDSVKRTIDTLAEKGVISQPQIVDGEKSPNGVIEKLYRIGKRDSFVIVAQLSPEFTARLVDRWQELERNGGLVTGQESLANARVTLLERLRASGVISQPAAERAGLILLGIRPPRAPRAPATPARQMELLPVALPKPVTAPAPAKKHLKITVTKPLALSFDDGIQLVLTEVAGYVGGGYETLTTVMVSRGLLSQSLQPTASGKQFVSSKSPRGNHWRVSALLRHLSA